MTAPSDENPTHDQQPILRVRGGPDARQPGLIVAMTAGAPSYQVVPITGRREYVVGRHSGCDVVIADDGVSRQHLQLEHANGEWTFCDLASNNGTFVDGVRVSRQVVVRNPKCLRLGLKTIVVPVDDVGAYTGRSVRADGNAVIGPLVAAAYDKIAQWAEAGFHVLVRGETGTGKHGAAEHFARACRRALHPVNAALAKGDIAASILFGAKKGAYSGADADREGWFGAANGKALFLDEIAEMGLDAQATILRAIENGEILPVGAPGPRKVDVRIVAATHVDLEAAVRDGTFRADLLGRLEKRSVTIPPLRERAVDVPWMIAAIAAREAAASGRPALGVSATLVEACVLHPWPRNARQLDTAIGVAIEDARDAGDEEIAVEHCDEVNRAEATSAAPAADASKLEALKAAYARTGSVRRAAEEVGVPRSTAHAWLRGK